MHSHTYADESDPTVDVTAGTLVLSPGHIGALWLAAWAFQPNRAPSIIARLVDFGVRRCTFQAAFKRPFGTPRSITIRGFGMQYHSAEDPQQSYFALTVYILGPPKKNYVMYGNLVLGSEGNAVIRPGIRCAPKHS